MKKWRLVESAEVCINCNHCRKIKKNHFICGISNLNLNRTAGNLPIRPKSCKAADMPLELIIHALCNFEVNNLEKDKKRIETIAKLKQMLEG